MKRRLVTGLAALGAVSMATPAHAALHTWSLIPYIADPLEHALGGGVDLDHLVTFTLVAALLMLISVRLGAKYRKMLETGDISPSPKFSLMNVVETIAAAVKGLLTEVVGPWDDTVDSHGHTHKGSKQYFTLCAGFTFAILFTNLTGLLPYSSMATANINTTLALALVSFFSYNYFGVKAVGLGNHLKHFMGPVPVMAPLMVPIEIISHLARPLSLSLRLFGNMMGDHTVFAVFMVGLGISIPLVFPVPFLFLGTLVCVVQTLVFVLLTMVYISLATASDH
ncbi:MAG: F0F1 ATP synthase subunit A [Deltaproteobacteria bacterium]|nr:F0F1 ATP synthase subunit A [bacterium]MCB9477478.1 F0F1 ATP synthase subunit A [Deltaproteobacteria bacterium]MCB9479295.1 F0F1 ATP synthase subunit A [Deltaproteobacteria bacterium]MCB9488739.1 F0F1 ATP synthase subunit A [Deltaproteobacteria bacterium]